MKQILNYKLLLIFIIALSSVQCQHQPSYEDYNQHQPMHVEVKGSRGTMLDKVEILFNNKKYDEANLHLSRLAGYYQTNMAVQLYYAISLLETNQYSMAEMIFTKISKTTAPEQYEAVWYLALSALKQNKIEECKAYLHEIPKESDVYKKATELLERFE